MNRAEVLDEFCKSETYGDKIIAAHTALELHVLACPWCSWQAMAQKAS